MSGFRGLLLLFLSLWPCAICSAENTGDLSAIARELGLPPDSPEVSKFARTLDDISHGIAVKYFARSLRADLPIAKHLRANDGVPVFSAQAAPQIESGPSTSRAAAPKVSVFESHQQMMRKAVDYYTHVPDLPDCPNAATKRNQFNPQAAPSERGSLDSVILDQLYVRKGEGALNQDEVYGKRTRVSQYDSSKPNWRAFAALGHNVPCLPYRIRITRSTIYIDQGENALKNYDGGYSGAGTLKPGSRISPDYGNDQRGKHEVRER